MIKVPSVSGVVIVTWKVKVIAFPPLSVPTSTTSGSGPERVPSVLVNEPDTKLVCMGRASVMTTLVASAMPVLLTHTV